jgi:hypothetical protein
VCVCVGGGGGGGGGREHRLRTKCEGIPYAQFYIKPNFIFFFTLFQFIKRRLEGGARMMDDSFRSAQRVRACGGGE